MRAKLVIGGAIALSIIIRAALLTQDPTLAPGAYETLMQMQHIADTGTPLTTDPNAWGGAVYANMPLFYYLLAFIGMFIPAKAAALITPNILISLLPIPIYLLAWELTKNKTATNIATIASIFIPTLYTLTLRTAHPITLALPLMLLTYYYFLRIGKTPRDQIQFLIAVIALTFTHPIAFVIAPAMGLTLLFTKIQKTRFSHAMIEATVFTTFLTAWAAVIIYRTAIQNHGISVLWVSTTIQGQSIAELATLAGALPLLLGSFAAYHYFREEQSPETHAVAALAITTVALMLIGTLSLPLGMLLLGTTLIVLSAPAIRILQEMRDRSRAPKIHTIGYAALLVLFVFTSVAPAVAVPEDGMPVTDEAIARMIARQEPGATVMWDQEHGFMLGHVGLATVTNDNELSHPRSQEIMHDLERLEEAKTEVRLVSELNRYEVDYLVLPTGNKHPLSRRCFEPTYQNEWEVYEVKCVVQ